MNNHQLELAEKLGSDGYLEYCVCSTLAETLENFNESKLKIFPSGDLEKFRMFIDELFSTKQTRSISKDDKTTQPDNVTQSQTELEESQYLK